MPDSKRYADWYSKAQSDFKGAKILLAYDGDYALVAFHAQQAIEKALKGYILRHKNRLIEGHSLIYMCRESITIDGSFKRFLKDVAFVNQFYIETRYPADNSIELTEDDARECIDIAHAILTKIMGNS